MCVSGLFAWWLCVSCVCKFGLGLVSEPLSTGMYMMSEIDHCNVMFAVVRFWSLCLVVVRVLCMEVRAWASVGATLHKHADYQERCLCY